MIEIMDNAECENSIRETNLKEAVAEEVKRSSQRIKIQPVKLMECQFKEIRRKTKISESRKDDPEFKMTRKMRSYMYQWRQLIKAGKPVDQIEKRIERNLKEYENKYGKSLQKSVMNQIRDVLGPSRLKKCKLAKKKKSVIAVTETERIPKKISFAELNRVHAIKMKLNEEMFESHQSKCRCCFKHLSINDQQVQLTPTHAENFYLLTHLELRLSSQYSSVLCTNCDFELFRFKQFRLTAFERQQKLYELHPEYDYEECSYDVKPVIDFLAVDIIKEEPEDQEMKDCSVIVTKLEEDDLMEYLRSNECIKSEVDIYEPEGIDHSIFNMKTNSKNEKKRKEEGQIKLLPFSKRIIVDEKFRKQRKKIRRGKQPAQRFCDLCDFSAMNRSSIISHMTNRHLPKAKFVCEICGYSNIAEKRLKQHSWRFHENMAGGFPCIYCTKDKKYFTEAELQYHIRAVHMPDKKPKKKYIPKKPSTRQIFKCEHCGKEFMQKDSLGEHFMRLHSTDEPTFLCDSCPQRFMTIMMLREHIRVRHPKVTFKCPYEGCQIEAWEKRRLEKHVEVVHSKKEKIFICDQCSRGFASHQQFRLHVLGDHLNQRFKCVVPGCNALYKMKYHVKRHMEQTHNLSQEELEKFNKILKTEQRIVVNQDAKGKCRK